MKKIIRIIKSMTFAVILLLILGASSIIGSLIPQNEPPSFYLEAYGENRAGLIQSLSLDRVFSSIWFMALLSLLCISLLVCIIFRVHSLLGLWKKKNFAFCEVRRGPGFCT